MSDILNAFKSLEAFRGESLAKNVAKLEKSFLGTTKQSAMLQLDKVSISAGLLGGAWLVKRNASQIDEIVHTLGILLALPKLLEPGEQVECLSLAAGNTGKGCDLSTNLRLAEFTFIRWQGGSEVIRQNKVFKDFYFLAEAETNKRRELFVLGTDHIQRFLSSRRNLGPILQNNAKLGQSFRRKYGEQFNTVGDYYKTKMDVVSLRDIREFIPVELI